MTAMRIRWWMIVAAFVIFLVLPGPDHSPFSGAPLASKALPVFFAVILAGVFSLLYAPRRAPRWVWLVLLILLIAGKAALAPRLVPTGWRGTYWTPTEWTTHVTELRVASFVTNNRIRTYRIDRVLAFEGATFSFDFLNDGPPAKRDELMPQRDVSLPLRIRWEGWIAGGAPQQLSISCRGHIRVSAGTVTLLEADNAKDRTVAIPATNGPIVIDYYKPPGVIPMINVAGVSGVVTPAPSTPSDVARGARAGSAITLLGLLTIAVFGIACIDAYAPLRSLPAALFSDPFALSTFVIVAIVVLSALDHTIPARHSTVSLGPYDDPLIYEAHSREVVRYGILMVDSTGHAGPYYFYPLYSYALAGAHLLFGEDFITIILFNDLCIAATVFLTWLWLRRRVSSLAGIIILVLVAFFVKSQSYVGSAYTDNLFVPFVLATLLSANAALDRRSRPMFFVAGLLSALTAATRPSFLMFVPFMGLWLLIDRKSGSMIRRFAAAAVFGVGFLVAIAPFTARNWIVSGRPVLLVDGAINLPLFITPPDGPRIPLSSADGARPGVGGALLTCLHYFREHPILTVVTALRKVGFTFGMPFVGPRGVDPPRHMILLPILFAFAVWLRRVPRNLQSVAIVFFLSHLTAMVAAAPWTYGYKTIIPFHVVMLVGLVFLIPKQRSELQPARRREIGSDPTVAIIPLDDGVTAAAVQRRIDETDAEFILFAAEGRCDSADLRKLLAYAGEFDIVDGIHGSSFGMRWPDWIVAKYAGVFYSDLTLVDAGGKLRLVRREVAEALGANLIAEGQRIGIEMTLRILSERLRVVQIPVSDPLLKPMSGAEAIRAIGIVPVIYREERKRSAAQHHSAISAAAEAQLPT